MESAGVGWIAAIIIGGIAGWLAEKFMNSSMGLLMNILLGIVGAIVANCHSVGLRCTSPLGGWLGYLIAGFVGACILIASGRHPPLIRPVASLPSKHEKPGRIMAPGFSLPEGYSLAAAQQAEQIGNACRHGERQSGSSLTLSRTRSVITDASSATADLAPAPARPRFPTSGRGLAQGCDLRRKIVCCNIRLDARGCGLGGGGFQFGHGLLLFHRDAASTKWRPERFRRNRSFVRAKQAAKPCRHSADVFARQTLHFLSGLF
jgi:uncharacterized membrane protein YeaQ/YmgE (transglycosylase-associated protein family)